MSGSRFDKLEPKRAPGAEAPDASPGAALGRFGAEPQAAEPAPALPIDPHRLPEQPPPLARFEADGSQGMGLEEGERRDLPFLRCPRCERDCSKYSTACHACGASLETPEALAYNDALWAKLRAEREADVQQTSARREADLKAIDELHQTLGAGAYGAQAAEEAERRRRTAVLVLWSSGLAALLIALFAPWWPLRLVAALYALGLSISRVPGLWTYLNRPIDR